MTGPVALPEKTLEHWVSQYILFRFRTNAQVWWPPYGADIEVRSLPHRPGKAFYFELKTAKITSGGHEVKIDLKQLMAYLAQPLGRQPFYVLPLPKWPGEIEGAASAAWRGPRKAPDFAFIRSGYRWFGNWTFVVTIQEVADCLANGLSKQAATKRRLWATLVRLNITTGDATWAGAKPPTPIPWRSFWNRIETCGDESWPQLFVIEREAAPTRTRVSYRELTAALRESLPPRATPEMARQDVIAQNEIGDPRLPQARRRTPPPNLEDRDVVLYELVSPGTYEPRELTASQRVFTETVGHRASTFLGVDELWLKQT
jgi:hypothetical protein